MNIEKPKVFGILGKTNQLQSIAKDLIDIGYKDNKKWPARKSVQKGISLNYKTVSTLDKYKEICNGCDNDEYAITFQLPQDYQKALDYAKQAIESEYWEESRKDKFVKGDFVFDLTTKVYGIVDSISGNIINVKQFYENPVSNQLWNYSENYKLITEQEYKDVLLAYAKEKYPVGCLYKSKSGSINTLKGKDLYFHYNYSIADRKSNGLLYDDRLGWAEIIEEELISVGDFDADFSNKGIVKFGCCELTKKEVQTVIDCMKILSKIEDSAGKISLSRFQLLFIGIDTGEDSLYEEQLQEVIKRIN